MFLVFAWILKVLCKLRCYWVLQTRKVIGFVLLIHRIIWREQIKLGKHSWFIRRVLRSTVRAYISQYPGCSQPHVITVIEYLTSASKLCRYLHLHTHTHTHRERERESLCLKQSEKSTISLLLFFYYFSIMYFKALRGLVGRLYYRFVHWSGYLSS